jgi:hypothetical protein
MENVFPNEKPGVPANETTSVNKTNGEEASREEATLKGKMSLQCDVCGKSFAKARLLRFHKHTHLKYDERPYECNICGRHYAYPYHILRHHRAKHENVESPSS